MYHLYLELILIYFLAFCGNGNQCKKKCSLAFYCESANECKCAE